MNTAKLQDIRSIPVGYMDIFEMHPLDFEEFIKANGVSQNIIDYLLILIKILTFQYIKDSFHKGKQAGKWKYTKI